MSDPEAVERLERAVLKLEQSNAAGQPDFGDRMTAVLEAASDGDVLQSVGEPILLDRAGRVLRQDKEVAARWSDVLQAIDRQHARMVDVHQKFAAMLDLSVGIEDLLYKYLDTWQVLEEPIGRRFSEEEEVELERLRWESTKPSGRLHSFFERYVAMLGSDEQSVEPNRALSTAIDSALNTYAAREAQATVYALFADPAARIGVCRPVAFKVEPGAGTVFAENDVDVHMKDAIQRAFTLGCHLAGMPHEDKWELRWYIFEPKIYEGESIGLAAAIGVASQLQDAAIDCYTAFTGTLAFHDRRVERVEYLREKLLAARTTGFRRVFVPRQNLNEVADLASDTFAVYGVDTIDEAWRLLQPTPADSSHRGGSLDARIRRFELECLHRGLKVDREEGSGEIRVRLRVTDHRDRGSVAFYDGKQGVRAVPGGSPNTDVFRTLKSIHEAMFGQPQPTSPDKALWGKYDVKRPDERATVQAALCGLTGYDQKAEENCDYRAEFTDKGERVIVRQYSTGTLTVQQARRGPADDPLFTAVCRRIEVALKIPTSPNGGMVAPAREDESPPRAAVAGHDGSTGSALSLRSLGAPWIGIDESGKGDYFGPLVSAAVYVDHTVLDRLDGVGIRDSKQLSDARIRELAGILRQICGPRVAVVEIHPEKYNELYTEFRREKKSLTQLLAWSHARALEDLLSRFACDNVLADQFADVEYLRGRLLEKGRAIKNYIAMPKAESDIAVAAASILARDRFLYWLESGSRKYSIRLFKGASPQVIESAKQIVQQFGRAELAKVAKLHFKTTEQVTGAG